MGTHIGNTNDAERLGIRNAKQNDWLRLKMEPGKKNLIKIKLAICSYTQKLYESFIYINFQSHFQSQPIK